MLYLVLSLEFLFLLWNGGRRGTAGKSVWWNEEAITEKYSAEEAIAHNATLTGALKADVALTQEQANAYNAKITGAAKAQGNTLTAEEAASYNATLEGAVQEGYSKPAKTSVEPTEH